MIQDIKNITKMSKLVQKKLTKRSGHKFKFENDSKNNDFKFFGIG